jgi:hypothetical protein
MIEKGYNKNKRMKEKGNNKPERMKEWKKKEIIKKNEKRM